MKPNEIQFSLNLEALSPPQCRRIVAALFNSPLSHEDLSKVCKLSPASIDKHLALLKDSGLVKVRVKNGEQMVHLQMAMLQPTFEWFSKYVFSYGSSSSSYVTGASQDYRRTSPVKDNCNIY